MGIWALIVLLDPKVRAAFGGSSAPISRPNRNEFSAQPRELMKALLWPMLDRADRNEFSTQPRELMKALLWPMLDRADRNEFSTQPRGSGPAFSAGCGVAAGAAAAL